MKTDLFLRLAVTPASKVILWGLGDCHSQSHRVSHQSLDDYDQPFLLPAGNHTFSCPVPFSISFVSCVERPEVGAGQALAQLKKPSLVLFFLHGYLV